MVKVVLNNGQYKITIPKELALAKGWTAGTVLRFIETPEGDVILREMPQISQTGGRKRK
ncbi:AbrB/MazE/SpoVT family DNA-binding domain-containing protein [Candidatus Woesearchaeota archaeon]|nr:AbrB/MazE/SpoVT family DNA-binding domain-containing protein [Candidatus Woesearchaeota archaeon]